jgi:uncharacterized OB-fold protein
MSDFAIPACTNCGHPIWPPRLACPVCGAAEWTEVDASTGTVLEVTDAPGASGETTRLGTVRPNVPSSRQSGKGTGRGAGEGPPVVARCEGCEVGDEVELHLSDGAVRAHPRPSRK